MSQDLSIRVKCGSYRCRCFYTPAKQMSLRVYVCVSVCVQNTSFYQSPGRGIKSHLVTL